ncbi:hypothetical protein QNE87_004198 [Vibrio vulnificus]|nr:hypothetical protein [Vibrio vulnificus]MBE4378811.1 hypothetical protein [Vibrio parahaemolyticus]
MENWLDHMAIAGFILGILSFVVTIIGTWQRLKDILQFFTKRSVERKISKNLEALEEIERFNEGNYLLAYVLQKVVMMLIVFFMAYVTGVKAPDMIDYKNFNFVMGMAASWAIGNLAGNSYRACRYVIKREVITDRLNTKIALLRNRQ